MFFLSWLTALGSATGSVCLRTDTLSPVNHNQRIIDNALICNISESQLIEMNRTAFVKECVLIQDMYQNISLVSF